MLRFTSQLVFFVFLLCVIYVTLRSRRFFFMPGVNVFRKEAPAVYWLLFVSLLGCALAVLGRAGYLLYAGAHGLAPFDRQDFFSMHDALIYALSIATFLGLSYLLIEDRLTLSIRRLRRRLLNPKARKRARRRRRR